VPATDPRGNYRTLEWEVIDRGPNARKIKNTRKHKIDKKGKHNK